MGIGYGLRWLLSAHHPMAYMATSALSNTVQNVDYGLQSGLSSSGIPNIDFGSLLKAGIGNFSQYQSTLRQFQATFGETVKGMGKDFAGSVKTMQDGLNSMGYTRQNLVEYMDQIGRATGRTGKNLGELTENTLAFARAYSVSTNSLRATAQTFGRLGENPWEVGSSMKASGVPTPLLDETLQSLSNLVGGQMDRGGTAGAARASAGLVSSINRMGDALRSAKGGAYMGAGGVRLAGQIDAGFASGSAMAMIANPMGANEGWAEYRARLENPTGEMLKNAVDSAKGMGPDAGALMLVKGFGMSYTDALNLMGGGGRGAGLGAVGLGRAEDASKMRDRAARYTTRIQKVSARGNDVLTDALGADLAEALMDLVSGSSSSEGLGNYESYQHITPENLITTVMGTGTALISQMGLKKAAGHPEDKIALDADVFSFNRRHPGSALEMKTAFPGFLERAGGMHGGLLAGLYPHGYFGHGVAGNEARINNLASLKTAKDTADFLVSMASKGGSVDMATGIVTFNKGLATAADSAEALATSMQNAIKRLDKMAPDGTKSVGNGRKLGHK